ncbi:MAG: YbaK/EbsC family protein [Pseudomonadota bacterium]
MAKTSSRDRVREAAHAAGLDIELIEMPASTRTAEDAATACACAVGQIVKSLIFHDSASGSLVLLLVSGANQVNIDAVARQTGLELERADATRVRAETGFAIGGVAPIGHLAPLATYIDEDLMGFDTLYAAGGSPNTVFAVTPQALLSASGASALRVTA